MDKDDALVFSVLALGYLGVGFLIHWILIGDGMSVYSAGTWGIMIGWPALIGGFYLLAVMFLAAIVGIVETITNRRQQ